MLSKPFFDYLYDTARSSVRRPGSLFTVGDDWRARRFEPRDRVSNSFV
jgi:hypothetical protein